MNLRAFLLAVSILPSAVCAAQEPSSLASRTFLQSELTRVGNGPSAGLIRARLESGDFQPGDRIYIRVRGDSVLSDTFTVLADQQLPLPGLGAVPLRGVLRSEVSDKISEYLSHYLRDPQLEVRPLMRVSVEGQVARPGFYATAPERPLANVIDAAGGFTQLANMTGMRLQRGTTTILSGRQLQQALGQGYSLDRLNVRPGDRVLVPQRKDSEHTLRIIALILSVPVGILALTKVF